MTWWSVWPVTRTTAMKLYKVHLILLANTFLVIGLYSIYQRSHRMKKLYPSASYSNMTTVSTPVLHLRQPPDYRIHIPRHRAYVYNARKFVLDPLHCNTTRESSMKYLKEITALRANLSAKLRRKTFFQLEALHTVYPKHIQQMVAYWHRLLGRGDFLAAYTLDTVIHDLKLLTERSYRTKPRPESCERCFLTDFNYLIEPKQNTSNVDIVTLVTTVPKATKERTAIRETWGLWAKEHSKIRVIFLFGIGRKKENDSLLEMESKQHGDILQADFIDHYYNLTQKVLSGYKWVIRNFPGVKFVIRAADDTFVHLPNIHFFLSVNAHRRQFLDYQVGYCLHYIGVLRFPWFKNHFTTFDYDKTRLPPYAHGSVFLTSLDLTKKILEASVNVPYFHVEDTYFGMVLPRIRSGCLTVQGFNPRRGGHTQRFYFSSHNESPERLHGIYNFFMQKK